MMNKIKYIWRTQHFNTEFTLELQKLSEIVFSKLKSCEENMTLRKKNFLLENDCNTEFQILLFDFLFEEEELYSNYDEIFEQKKLDMKSNFTNNKKYLFNPFIKNYKNIFLDIYNNRKKIDCLKKLRWYILFDNENFSEENYFANSMLFKESDDLYMKNDYNNNLNDSFDEKQKEIIYNKFIAKDESLLINNDINEKKEFIMSEKVIDILLNEETNPLLYLIKLIFLSIIIFCKETMCHLNVIYDEKKSENIIKEYTKRFNNFIQAAKYINTQCQNLNIITNYLDKEILMGYPHFPKFSIFRLCLKIWYSEMSSILTEDNTSLLTKIQKSLIKLFYDYTNDDFNNILNNKNSSYNSFQSFLTNSGKNSNLFFSSDSKNYSLSTSVSIFNSNEQTLETTFCPFGSLYEDNFAKYFLIEKGLGIVYETFSDEYSVYLLNKSDLDTNNYYNEIEKNFLEIIENGIKRKINENLINNKENDDITTIKNLKEKILNYFGSYFYDKKIINKLKFKVYSSFINVLKKIIFEYIYNKIKENSSNNNIKINTNIKLDEKYITELKQHFPNNQKINIEKQIYGINCIENLFSILFELDKWIEKETQNFKNLDKKIIKELDKKNISSSYNALQKYLLSYSIENKWEILKKIRAIENYHININNKDKQKNSKNIPLKKTFNAYSEHNDLNNFNDQFLEYDDEEGEDNNNYFNNQINDLKGSNIFF